MISAQDAPAQTAPTAFDPTGLTVYVNGEFVDGNSARISVFDHGLLYGDGVFEGMRVFGGGLYRPWDHLERLSRSARGIGMELPLPTAELTEVITEVVKRCGLRDAHVRPIVTRGFGAPGLDPWRCERPTIIVQAYPFPPLLGNAAVRLLTSAIVRKAPRSIGAHVKSCNYLDAILAKAQAKACGANDALMLDSTGAVAECTGANIFMFDGDRLITPTTRAALPGITRRSVLECAEQLGVPTEVREVWPAELHTADGAFVTGSGAGIVPVGMIDGYSLASDDHSGIKALTAAYWARTRDPDYRLEISYS
jgi:branched-chain amino acid aminotransferase